MPQPDRRLAVGRLRVADGVDQVRFNRALRVHNGPLNIGATPQLRIVSACVARRYERILPAKTGRWSEQPACPGAVVRVGRRP